MATRSSKWWLPLVAAVMVGCASTEPTALDVAATAACECCDFPAPSCLLCGFDAAEPGGEWRVGDELLYGLRLRRGDDVQNWLLRLRVTDPLLRDDDGAELDPVEWKIRINGELQQFSSRRCRVAATVMDHGGHVLGESQPVLPRDFLDRGLGGACRNVERDRRHRHRRRWRGLPEPELPLRPLAEATVSAVALLQVIEQDSVLSPLLWEVVEKPSLWSVIGNLGAKVVVRPRFYELEDTLSPVEAAPFETWRVPISLFVNDAAALHVELMVADSAPPYAVGCGMLGATARHPSNPDVDFSVLLLAARRGR